MMTVCSFYLQQTPELTSAMLEHAANRPDGLSVAIAAVTADFAQRGRSGARRGAGRRQARPEDTADASVARNAPQANGTSNRGQNHRRQRGRGRGAYGPTTSASASENEASTGNSPRAVVDLPAPATQVSQTQTNHRPVPENHARRFRSQLSQLDPTAPSFSSSNPVASSSSHIHKQILLSAEELGKLSYRERLVAQLNSNSIDCPICINNIQRKQPIASCQTCSAPYHLKCLRDWAERSIASVKEKAAFLQQQPGVQIRANWRCPSCQHQYSEHEVPRNYWCFCGRIKEPRPSTLEAAHSCGSPCARERPEGCKHAYVIVIQLDCLMTC